MTGGVVVVPCYNEAGRIELPRFLELVQAGYALLFVDDGSMDQTPALLAQFAASRPEAVRVLTQARNQGKAEAVRQGLAAALASDAGVVGYLDADLATPPAEMLRVLRGLDGKDVALGSRVALLGRSIQRSFHRHLLGRAFATAASWALDLPVYDTQCGAKAFRDTPALRAAVLAPFTSRWAFDVELLSRLLAPSPPTPALGQDRFIEVPLERWVDVGGSKLRPGSMVKAGVDVLAMAMRARRRERLGQS